jgi:hypothetical protein
MPAVEYASASGDPGRNILLRSMKAGTRSLDLKVLHGINQHRRALGLDPVQPPSGSRLHRHLQVLDEARKLVREVERRG